MGQIRIADLPTLDRIDASSYIIVEKPGYETGTFKMKLMDLPQVFDLVTPSPATDSSLASEVAELQNLVASLTERIAVLEANQPGSGIGDNT